MDSVFAHWNVYVRRNWERLSVRTWRLRRNCTAYCGADEFIQPTPSNC